MTAEPKVTWQEAIETQATALLNEATTLTVGISDDESVYDLTYIGEKLAVCSKNMERLSELSIDLCRLRIDIHKRRADKKEEARLRSLNLRADAPEYAATTSREEKAIWLEQQLSSHVADQGVLEQLASLLEEVSNVVVERASLMRRLDSDVRLHQRLLEAKIAAGAIDKPGFLEKDKRAAELKL